VQLRLLDFAVGAPESVQVQNNPFFTLSWNRRLFLSSCVIHVLDRLRFRLLSTANPNRLIHWLTLASIIIYSESKWIDLLINVGFDYYLQRIQMDWLIHWLTLALIIIHSESKWIDLLINVGFDYYIQRIQIDWLIDSLINIGFDY